MAPSAQSARLRDAALERRPAVRGRFSARGMAVRLFFTCWLVYGLHFATNTVREIYPALSLGDRLSFDVSPYAGLHPDIFTLAGRGTFINSNPGASIMGALPYVAARPLIDPIVDAVQRKRVATPASASVHYDTIYPMAQDFWREARARGLDVKFGLAAGVMQALLMAPLSALSAVVMFWILVSRTRSPRASALLAALYAFATPVFYRTAQLNQNVLVAHCALFAFALLWRPWDDPTHPRRPHYLLAGLLCGWAVVLDYSGVIVLLVLSVYGLARRASVTAAERASGDIVRFIAGVTASGAVLLGYQWWCFGHPLYPAQHYMPPTGLSHLGYAGMEWPQLDLLWDTAFSMRFGLFTSAPLLLLAFYVPGWLSSRTRLVGSLEARCILGFSALFFLFCAANQYGRMQFNSGVRHVVPVSPFLFLLAAGPLLRMPRVAAWILGIVATYWSWCLAMYRDVEQGRGVLESVTHVTLEGFRLPWLVTLQRMGYLQDGFATVVLLLVAGGVVSALWWVGPRDAAMGADRGRVDFSTGNVTR